MVSAADFDVSFEGVLDRTAYLEALFGGFARPVGADNTGVADSLAAFQAADDAAASEGRALLILPGTYKFSGTLNKNPGVAWIGLPDATFINSSSASLPLLDFTISTSRAGHFTNLIGLGFGASVDNIGEAVVINNGGLNVRFAQCVWNGNGSGESPKLKGTLLSVPTSSSVILDTCRLNGIGNVGSLISIADVGALLRLTGLTKLVMPATFSHYLVDMGQGELQVDPNVEFDLRAHSGSAGAVNIATTTLINKLRGAIFRGEFGSGAAFTAVEGAQLDEQGSVFDLITPYNFAGALSEYSALTLGRGLTTTVMGSGAINLASGYRGQTVISTNDYGGNGPLCVMPTAYKRDQRYAFVLHNNSSNPWAGTGIAFSGVTVPTSADYDATLTNGYARSFNFIAVDADGDGDLRWALLGSPTKQWAVS